MTSQAIPRQHATDTGAVVALGRRAYRRRRVFALAGLLLALCLAVLLSTGVGSASLPLSSVWHVLLSRLPWVGPGIVGEPATVATIVLDIRLPRIILAGLVGAALATAGATYQGLFKNPLADPYLIGVAQGAALGAVVSFLLPGTWSVGTWITPLLAFAGALLSAGAVYLLARVGRTIPMTTLILGGVAMGAFLASITSYLLISSGDQLHGILLWLLGGFSLSQWGEVGIMLPYLAVGSAVIYLYAQPLNLMQLDEEQAQQLGVNVERVKLMLLGSATLITAAAVSFAGSIGFVGLIVPHAVRMLWGPDHRFLLPLSTLAGAVFLVLADTAARMLLRPAELPVGVLTAFCGAPFFLYILRQKKKVVF